MAIVSDRYREEQQALSQDPIIIAMEQELPADFDMKAPHAMMRAHRTYELRGGKGAQSIGGPWAAICLLRLGPEARL